MLIKSGRQPVPKGRGLRKAGSDLPSAGLRDLGQVTSQAGSALLTPQRGADVGGGISKLLPLFYNPVLLWLLRA